MSFLAVDRYIIQRQGAQLLETIFFFCLFDFFVCLLETFLKWNFFNEALV